MKLKGYKTFLQLLLITCTTNFACQELDSNGPYDSLPHFANQYDLETWIKTNKTNDHNERYFYAEDSVVADSVESTTGNFASTAAVPSNETITNNQETDVDEGGIVKNIGDYLVILRQGRLYSVEVAEQEEASLIDSISVATDEFLKDNVWYDELLVNGSQIVTIGYRYLLQPVNTRQNREIYGVTEINTFTLTSNGDIQRESTHFIESNDYYESDNSASRLVNGSLVLYMPSHIQHYIWNEDGTTEEIIDLPHRIEYNGEGDFTIGAPLITANEIAYHQSHFGMTLHTLIHCPVQVMAQEGPLQCESQAFLANWGREFYVSNTHAFVHSNDHIYAMRLNRDLWVGTHKIKGSTSDQFAYRQIGEELNIAVMNENSESSLNVLTLDLNDFDGNGNQSLAEITQQKVTRDQYYVDYQRYMNHYYIAASYDWNEDQTRILIHNLQTEQTEKLELDGSISRLEIMSGLGIFVVTSDDNELKVSIIKIDDDITLVDGPNLSNVTEGESRSHGFFYKGNAEGGLFALPILEALNTRDFDTSGFGSEYAINTQANMMFFKVNTQGQSNVLGMIRSENQADIACESSCVDWYGNTRPIFLKDRIYSLMGSEIKEVALNENEIEQVGERVLLDF